MAAMPDPLLIPVAKADIGRRLDQLLLVLVVLAIAVAWLAEPGKPLRFIAFAALIGLSWWVPRALNGSRRNTSCNPGSLCATIRIQYRQPVALRLHDDGALSVQWEAQGPWLAALQVRTLWLGALLHIAVDTRGVSDPVLSTESSLRSLENGSVPEAAAPMPLPGQAATVSEAPPHASQVAIQRGSCLLWLPRLGPAEAATVRRWLVWRKRGGNAPPGQVA